MEESELIDQIINEMKARPQKSKEQLKKAMREDKLRIERHKLSAKFEMENSFPEDPILHMRLSNNFSNWLKTEDLDYLDLIVVLLAKNNMPIKGVLLQALAIASNRRLARDCNYGKKTDYSKKIKIDINSALPATCEKIFLLREFCHKNSDDANFLAIGWLTMNYPNPAIKKSSSLVSKYGAWVKKNAQLIQDIKDTYPNGWTEEEQGLYLKQFLKNIPEELRGVPRT